MMLLRITFDVYSAERLTEAVIDKFIEDAKLKKLSKCRTDDCGLMYTIRDDTVPKKMLTGAKLCWYNTHTAEETRFDYSGFEFVDPPEVPVLPTVSQNAEDNSQFDYNFMQDATIKISTSGGEIDVPLNDFILVLAARVESLLNKRV